MSNIDDLDYKSLTESSTDEALEVLRQIRLNRRTPVRTVKTSKTKAVPKVSTDQAAELLKILMGDSND